MSIAWVYEVEGPLMKSPKVYEEIQVNAGVQGDYCVGV